MIENLTFASPYFLYLLLIIPFFIAWYWYKNKVNSADIRISNTEGFSKNKFTFKHYLLHALFVIRLLIMILIILALARPQSSSSKNDINIEGIDIVLAMDISGSMLAEDFKPNRIEASKEVAMNFIDGRPNDRIGLVIFSGESFTQCPLTADHAVIKNLFSTIKTGMIQDGTAIGNGLATAINRIKDSEAISKVIILLTDGINNAGEIDPLSAAEIAKLNNIRVYTIGVGTLSPTAPYPVPTPFGTQYQQIEVKIDEPMLKKIAEITNGKYFRADNKKKLEDIYLEIDKMEKSKIDVTVFQKKKEEFFPLILVACILLVMEIFLKNTYLKTIP